MWMKMTSLVPVVAPCTGKIIKKMAAMFLKEEKICYKMVYCTYCTLYLCHLSQSSEIGLQC